VRDVAERIRELLRFLKGEFYCKTLNHVVCNVLMISTLYVLRWAKTPTVKRVIYCVSVSSAPRVMSL
jgi:hypothetical protein